MIHKHPDKAPEPSPLFDPLALREAIEARPPGPIEAPAYLTAPGPPCRPCGSCGAPIFWARIRKKADGQLSEKPNIFDAKPIQERKGYVLDAEGIASHTTEAGAEARVYVSHFSSCPNAPQHRKG